ncbi:YveK family protein [Bacillus wiedmannii]|uniref:YveK family protein n=1 Tax=Bacillus wiedmannii TaxID=1890302 RepID=UPI000BF471EF|nr:Wzz/FepE/Etk N-terminal domain-containing protein [Bacillus wiedmannii]PGD66149.1 capsular biosynthesis protein [Bacillus wiedmannii]
MNDTISLKELFFILRKRIALILVIPIGFALISGIVSYYFMTPIYKTSTQILVNQQKQDEKFIEFNEVQTNLQLTNTYKVIIKSPVILNQVKEKLGLNVKIDQLKNEISVENEKDSQIIVVTVQDKNAYLARDIANTTVQIFKKEISQIMNIDNVTILSKAEVNEKQSPIKPNPVLNMAIAFVVGLIASIVKVLLKEYFDNTVKKEEDIKNLLGLPVLGLVSNIEEYTKISVAHTPSVKVRRR